MSSGERIEWRWPGVSGFWLDPHNWVGQTSGLYRIPREYDDVVIGGTSIVNGVTFTVTLESRGAPIAVNSLQVGLDDCAQECLSGQTDAYYHYNTSTGLWDEDFVDNVDAGRCAVALEIVAPTRLVVNEAVGVSMRSHIRFISNSDGSSSPVTLITPLLSMAGKMYGLADIYGSVAASGPVQVVRLIDGPLAPSIPQQAGTMTVYGNWTSSYRGEIYLLADHDLDVYSRLDIKGTATLLQTNYLFSPQTRTNKTFPVISFGSSTTENLTFAWGFIFVGPDDLWTHCSNTNVGFDYTYRCGTTSSHDFGTLFALPEGDCCPRGYGGTGCDTLLCPGVPPCSNRGQCHPPSCICHPGWEGFACEIPSCPGSPTQCSGNGECFAPLPLGSVKPFCKCRKGWGGDDCSTPLCPNNCTNSDHGICNTQGNSPKCICKAGYQPGPKLDCAPRIPSCPGQEFKECSGHGNCNDSICRCDAGWEGADCSLPVCPNGCNHHGVCVSNDEGTSNKCQCNNGWSGSDCSTPSCPSGCSGHGTCASDLDPPRCICDQPTTLPSTNPGAAGIPPSYYGWTGSACSRYSLPVCSDSDCVANGGECGGPALETCLVNSCPAGFTGWDCSKFVCSNTGYPECNGHGNCQLVEGKPQCVCRPGYTLGTDNSCQDANCEVTGCSGRGTCRTDLATPTCECDPYFYGPDCSIGTCPGFPDKCSGRGECLLNGSCECTAEWQGDDCSIPVCPTTNGINCNDHGFCNSSSSPFFCECYSGFTGQACETAVCLNGCNGNGFCDDSLSPPACRCDPFFIGDDCSTPGSLGDGDTQETMVTVISSLVAGGMVLACFIGIFVVVGCLTWSWYQRRKLRRSLHSLSGTLNL